MTTAPEILLADLSDKELTDLFAAGSLPDLPFTHRDHVRVAWQLLQAYDLGQAVHRMTEGVKQLASQRNLPNLFHATITVFYMLAVAECRSKSRASSDFEAFAARHPELLSKSREFLLGFYRADTLDSDAARRGFVLPDRWREGSQSLSSSS